MAEEIAQYSQVGWIGSKITRKVLTLVVRNNFKLWYHHREGHPSTQLPTSGLPAICFIEVAMAKKQADPHSPPNGGELDHTRGENGALSMDAMCIDLWSSYEY